MDQFQLNDIVVIKNGGLEGRVISIWNTIGGQPQYQVRFADKDGRPSEFWFFADDLRKKS